MELVGQVIEQDVDQAMDLLSPNRLVVVEHEHDVPLEPRELVEEKGQCDVAHVDAPRFERLQGRRSDSRLERAERVDDSHPEARGIAVAVVEREPGERPAPLQGEEHHSAIRVVFPYPAGASTSVSLRCGDDASSSMSAARAISSGRTPGMCSFVAARTAPEPWVGTSRTSATSH